MNGQRLARLRNTITTYMASILFSVGVLFGADIVSALLFVVFYQAKGTSSRDIQLLFSSSVTIQFMLALLSAVAVGYVLYLYLKKTQKTLSYFGVTTFKVKYLALAFGYMLLYFVSFLAIASIVKAIFPSINQEQKQAIGFDAASSLVHYGLMFLLIVVFIPIKEELLFRGFLFTKLRERTPFLISALTVSIVFGALHLELFGKNPLNWMAAIDTFTLSLFLCRVKEKSRSLWPSVLLHMLKNGVAFAVLFGAEIRLLLQR